MKPQEIAEGLRKALSNSHQPSAIQGVLSVLAMIDKHVADEAAAALCAAELEARKAERHRLDTVTWFEARSQLRQQERDHRCELQALKRQTDELTTALARIRSCFFG